MSETEEQKPGSSSAAEADIAEPEADQEQETEEEDGPEDVDAEALDLMGQGKRNLVVGDPPAAVQCFQEACELLASKYGETAEECGDAYYQYGCSLLELASMENGVLGNALQGVPDESADSADSDEEVEQKPSSSNIESADKLEEKEREEVIQQVKDALEANCESEESEKEDKGKEGEEGKEGKDEKMEEGGDSEEVEEKGAKDEKKSEKKEDSKKEEEKKDAEKEDSKMEKVKEEKEGEKSDEKKDAAKTDKGDLIEKEKKEVDKKTEKKDDDEEEAGPSTEDEQKEDGDDISNFQLAWEMLELSRVILSKKEDEESQKKVSQIHLKLGELGLETEQYTQSIVDFKACLVIQEKYLDPESRLIAGTHYNLGLACSFDSKFDDSIEHYRQSKQLIEKRLASLEKTVSETEGKGKEKADEKDPIVCAQKEIDELKELLPDVVSKLEDAKEMKMQAGKLSDGAGPSSSTSSGFASSSSAFAPSSSSEPIQQIAVKKADTGAASDISHLVRKKRKPEEETDAAADSKRSRQEGEGEKPAVNGSGDSKVVNGNGHMANGVMNGDMTNGAATNGDSKHSPEKPSEIKTKKLAADGDAPAAMETA